MKRNLLWILLSSWSLLVTISIQCETGVAKPNRVLNVPRSLMANADVAILKKYETNAVEKCLKDCCEKKYGNCNVASFKRNGTKENCFHFYCLPSNKCEFMSSNSTDSFSFSSDPIILHPVPFSNIHLNNASTTVNASPPKQSDTVLQQQLSGHELTEEKIATYSEEQFAMKNDNTTVKPRKGVEEMMPDYMFEANATRSSIKPRKGVNIEDDSLSGYFLKDAKSNVKPRKGVGPYISTDIPSNDSKPTSATWEHIIVTSTKEIPHDASLYHPSVDTSDASNLSNDLISALEKVFEDDPRVNISSTKFSSVEHSKTVQIKPTTTQFMAESMSDSDIYAPSTSRVTPIYLKSSISSSDDKTKYNSKFTPAFQKTSSLKMTATRYFDYTIMPSSISTLMHMHSVTPLDFQEDEVLLKSSSEDTEDFEEESENERKYKSSMHLVLSLVFGLLVLFAVLGVVAKRIYDGWLRRHYRRMDFLIDGMYNGYG